MNYIKLDGIGEYHDRGMSHSRSSHKNDDTSVTNFFSNIVIWLVVIRDYLI